MSTLTYEGTKDYLVSGVPALIVSLIASGSISAGAGVAFDAGNTSDVYVPASVTTGSINCAGIALNTVADNDPVSVCIFGFLKNLTSIGEAKTPGLLIALSGSAGAFANYTTGSFRDCNPYAIAGKVVSGSTSATGTFMAFINCMR